jgi:hypothetical protein
MRFGGDDDGRWPRVAKYLVLFIAVFAAARWLATTTTTVEALLVATVAVSVFATTDLVAPAICVVRTAAD